MPTIQQARVESGTGKVVFIEGQGGAGGVATLPSPLSFSVANPVTGIALSEFVSQAGNAITLGLRNLVAGLNVSITESDSLIVIGTTPFYDIVGYWRGLLPSDTAAIHYLEMVRSISLPNSLVGSIARCRVAPTSDVSLALKKNGNSIGTITFVASSTIGTFTFPATVPFVSGDVWEVDPPNPQDTTFAGLSWTIVATVS